MTQHDEVVERITCQRYERDTCCEWAKLCEAEQDAWRELTYKDFAAIQEGDSLGNGLWAAPIIASMKMTDAGRKVSRFGLGHIWDAMRRAAGGGDG